MIITERGNVTQIGWLSFILCIIAAIVAIVYISVNSPRSPQVLSDHVHCYLSGRTTSWIANRTDNLYRVDEGQRTNIISAYRWHYDNVIVRVVRTEDIDDVYCRPVIINVPNEEDEE